jgi:cytoskeletal protein CcmA (bactofilin family)
LSADEHLIIQGVVEGTVELKNHNLTIGESGRIQADIKAVVITVEGNLVGDMEGSEIVIIKRTATVKGNARAPRISVEEGANFNGSVVTNEDQHSDSVTELDKARQA